MLESILRQLLHKLGNNNISSGLKRVKRGRRSFLDAS